MNNKQIREIAPPPLKPNTLSDLGRFLRICRQKKQLRLYDMAKAAGIGSAQLSAIETGSQDIPEEVLQRLADCLLPETANAKSASKGK